MKGVRENRRRQRAGRSPLSQPKREAGAGERRKDTTTVAAQVGKEKEAGREQSTYRAYPSPPSPQQSTILSRPAPLLPAHPLYSCPLLLHSRRRCPSLLQEEIEARIVQVAARESCVGVEGIWEVSRAAYMRPSSTAPWQRMCA